MQRFVPRGFAATGARCNRLLHTIPNQAKPFRTFFGQVIVLMSQALYKEYERPDSKDQLSNTECCRGRQLQAQSQISGALAGVGIQLMRA